MAPEQIFAMNDSIRKSSRQSEYNRNIQTPASNHGTEPLHRIGRLMAHGGDIVKNNSIKSFEGNAPTKLPYM